MRKTTLIFNKRMKETALGTLSLTKLTISESGKDIISFVCACCYSQPFPSCPKRIAEGVWNNRVRTRGLWLVVFTKHRASRFTISWWQELGKFDPMSDEHKWMMGRSWWEYRWQDDVDILSLQQPTRLRAIQNMAVAWLCKLPEAYKNDREQNICVLRWRSPASAQTNYAREWQGLHTG